MSSAQSSRAPSAPDAPLDPATWVSPLGIPEQTDHVTMLSSQSTANNESVNHSLALLLGKLSTLAEAPKRSRPNTRTPDTFDGSDPAKIDNFIFQCSMYFAARVTDFPDDDSRVVFALSYLSDTPLDWFHGEMNQFTSLGMLPPWFTSYPTFISDLQRLFGPSDAATDAMSSIESLCYSDATKAPCYTIEFNQHARHTGWNDRALAHFYYSGLPERLKDEIAPLGKPATLHALQDLVHTLDQRYWERQSELSASPVPTSPLPPLICADAAMRLLPRTSCACRHIPQMLMHPTPPLF